MKKLLSVLLIGVLFITGCQNNVSHSESNTETTIMTEAITSGAQQSEGEEETIVNGGAKEDVQQENLILDAVQKSPPIISKEGDQVNLEVIQKTFDYGRFSFTSKGAMQPVSFNLNGTISRPKTGKKYPLVLFIHGSYDNTYPDKRYDTGFSYLTQHIATGGFVGVTLNVQPAYVWGSGEDYQAKIDEVMPQFLEALKTINETGKLMPDASVEEGFIDSLDLSKIYLIGHSKGGGYVYHYAKYNTDVKGFISIAPTVSSDVATQRDIPFMTIVPALDGDVSNLMGHVVAKSEYALKRNRKSPLYYVMANDMCHNRFSTVLRTNDAVKEYGKGILTTLASKALHQQFLARVAKDFLLKVEYNNGNNPLFKEDAFIPTKLYGANIASVPMLGSNREKLLLNAKNIKRVQITDGVKAVVKRAHVHHQKNEFDGFVFPLINDTKYNHIDLIDITYNKENHSIILPLNRMDFSEYKALNFELATVSYDPLNHKKGQGFTLVLKDKSGKVATVVIDQNTTSALEYVAGSLTESTEKEEGSLSYVYSRLTPLAIARLPLKQIETQLNIKEISSVTLLFDQHASGRIVMESMYLTK